MYHEIQNIRGVWYYRTSPQGAWKEADGKTLTERSAYATQEPSPVIDHAAELAKASKNYRDAALAFDNISSCSASDIIITCCEAIEKADIKLTEALAAYEESLK
jgi:hypothetical protein